jgi:ATP-dependent DNA helicase DinG
MIAPLETFPSDFERQVTLAFGPGGLLARSKNFEYRPQQQTMAAAVARACRDRTHLIAEAGTGVGKSLAYLVPAVLHALEENRKALISTHTINLQEQLFYKDIPLVQKLIPTEFKAVLLKGRQNYLCPRRLERAMRQGGELFANREQEELKRIWEWSHRTADGTLSDLDPAPDPQVWLQVCSEPHLWPRNGMLLPARAQRGRDGQGACAQPFALFQFPRWSRGLSRGAGLPLPQ